MEGTTTAYRPTRGWIDMAFPSVPHYGWKWLCQAGGGAGTTYYVDWIVSMYVSFRARR